MRQKVNNTQTNILAIDDHPLFTTGLQLLFDSCQCGYQCHSASDLNSALKSIKKQCPDLVLLDLKLNYKHWSDNIASIQKAVKKHTAIAVISSNEDSLTVRNVMAMGIQGFIPKSSPTDVLLAAIHLIIAGGVYIPPQLNANTPAIDETQAFEIKSKLSKRQKQVLKQAIHGKPNKVIANELHLSESTVKSHLSTAYRVLNVRNRLQALQICEEMNLFNSLDSLDLDLDLSSACYD